MTQPVIVILAGGRGERFWPLSRSKFPKQLLPFRNGISLLQMSADRIRKVVDDSRLLVVVNRDYCDIVQYQLPMVPPENLIIEPESRNTAPAIGLTALVLKERFPGDTQVIFIPSDLYIDQPEDYQSFLNAMIDYSTVSDRPAIGGTRPTRPETGFGYIQTGKKLGRISGYDYREIVHFKEKPGQQLAEEYLKTGEYLWNAGVFSWRLNALLESYQTHLPVLFDKLQQYRLALAATNHTEADSLYHRLPSVSFDEGIVEPSARELVVLVGEYTWSDLGNWNAWTRFWPTDMDGNRIQGQHFKIDTQKCIIYSPDKPVATLGLSDLVIVAANDILLVCDRNRVQDIKEMVNLIKEEGRWEIL